MNKLLKKTLKIILPILLGGFILYWVYRDFDFSKAEEVLLHQTNWWWMLLSTHYAVAVPRLRLDEEAVRNHALVGRVARLGGIDVPVVVVVPFGREPLPGIGEGVHGHARQAAHHD